MAKGVCGMLVITRNADTFTGCCRSIKLLAEVRGTVASSAAVTLHRGAGQARGVAGLANFKLRRPEVAGSAQIMAPFVAYRK